MIGTVDAPWPYRRGRLAAALAGLLLAGCGSVHATGLPADVAARMRSDLDKVQAAASAHDVVGASRALSAFASDVAAQHSTGQLSATEYAAFQTAIARTRARVGAEIAPPAATTPALPPAAPQPANAPTTTGDTPAIVDAPGNGPGKSKDRGKGKAKGNGGD